jgi:hypothetical protein
VIMFLLSFPMRSWPKSLIDPEGCKYLALAFPSGHYRYLNPRFLGTDAIGGGSYIFTTGLDISKCLNPFILCGNLWYSLATAFAQNEQRRYPRDVVTVNLAGEYLLMTQVTCSLIST